jgi:hypothetical protein
VTTSDDDVDVDAVISRLAAPLEPAFRQAFREAALDALTRVPCWGEGAIYRAVAVLQRQFFDPPPDARHANLGARHLRPSKLSDGPPIGAEDPRTGGRDRHRLRAV